MTNESIRTTALSNRDKRIPDGYAKLLNHPKYARLPYNFEGETTTETSPPECFESGFEFKEDISETIPKSFEKKKDFSFKDFLDRGVSRLKKDARAAVFNVNIDITKLSTQMVALGSAGIEHRIILQQRAIVPPSPSLVMSREKVLLTSLMAPSGALLAWLEMEMEESANNEQN